MLQITYEPYQLFRSSSNKLGSYGATEISIALECLSALKTVDFRFKAGFSFAVSMDPLDQSRSTHSAVT